MMTTVKTSPAAHHLPPFFIGFAVLVSIAPFLLGLLGVDLSSGKSPFDASAIAGMSPQEVVDGMFSALGGGVTHTLLEASAVLTALFVMVLALLRYKATGDVTTPIIGLALLFSGFIDGFHTLAADRLIETIADTRNLVPFTWALCRIFNSVIMIFGVGMLLVLKFEPDNKRGKNLLWTMFFVYSVMTFIIIGYCLTAKSLPQTLFPENIVTRPFDLYPLFLFLFAVLFVYRPFYKKHPGIFSHAILLSAIPDLATQFHMVLGSSELYDHHFNAAHFLKIMSYFLPLAGLCLDYIRTHKNLQSTKIDLVKSESHLSTVLETANDAIITINKQGVVQSFNLAAKRLFGYHADEVIGKNIKILMPEPDRSSHKGYLENYNRTQVPHIIGIGREVVGLKKDGTTFPVYLSISEMKIDSHTFFTGILHDITHLKETEIELRTANKAIKSAQAQLIEAEKMAVLGKLSGIVAHELRNPLNAMKSSVYYLNTKVDNGNEKFKKHLGIIQRGIDNSDRIITDVLGFAKIRKPEYKDSDINSAVRAALTDSQVPVGIKTHIDLDREIPELPLDEAQLHQVFINIIANAVQAMQEQGELRIQTRLKGNWVEISYADDGPGIDEGTLAKVFEPLFTTKTKGTGLGLAVCKSLIQGQGGQIQVKSRRGHGTTFTVLLPLKKIMEGND